jgi:hypothetical protein
VNLFPWIHQDHCHGTNLAADGSAASTSSLTSLVLRPHDTRHATDAEHSVSSIDESSGFLITVTFSELVRVKQVLITSATGDERIERCKIWVNRIDPPDLDEAEEDNPKPDQEFALLAGERDCVEYPVRVARFSNVSNLTVYLVSQS